MQPQVSDLLKQCEPVTIQEMDGVKLMNRTDTKFMFNITDLSAVLLGAEKKYKIVDIEGNRIRRYKTLYFDTKDFNLYKKNHNGKLNRYSVMHGTYVECNSGFLKVKFKNIKGQALKSRINEIVVPGLKTGKDFAFLLSILPFGPLLINAVLVWRTLFREKEKK